MNTLSDSTPVLEIKTDMISLLHEAVSGWAVPLVIGGLVVVFLLKLFYPRIKGAAGEWQVNRMLKGLPTEGYRVLANLLLPNGRDGLAQIDQVVVCRFGLFVIETKNWRGWVFGTEGSKKWTITYPGGRKRTVRNPLRQNGGHVQAVMQLLEPLGVNPAWVHGVVFLSARAVLKKGPIQGVVQRDLRGYLMGYREVRLSDEVMAEAVEVLVRASLSGDAKAVARHREGVRALEIKKGRGRS
jgi:hypothetical protein